MTAVAVFNNLPSGFPVLRFAFVECNHNGYDIVEFRPFGMTLQALRTVLSMSDEKQASEYIVDMNTPPSP